MKIAQQTNNFTNQTTYDIRIEQDDDLDVWEIVECFLEQYPKEQAVVSYSKVVQAEAGLILVGLDLPKLKRDTMIKHK